MGPLAQFTDHLQQGRFMLQQCDACTRYFFAPRMFCPHCKSPRWTWREACCNGTVHAVTVVARSPQKGGDYNVVLVDLDEGPRMMSRVIGIAPEQVRIGMRVRAQITMDTADAQPLIEFVAT